MTVEIGKLRLLHLLRLLFTETDEEHGLTMPQIIERLADEGIPAERKALYRDLEVLREFGLEVHMYPRRPVEYGLSQRPFSLSQLLLMVDSVQSSRFLTQSNSDALVRSLKKMASKHQAKSLSKRVHVEGRVSSQNESAFSSVDAIHHAMRLKRKISFLYFKHDLKKRRKLQREGKRYLETPVHLVYAEGFYYLITFNEKYDDFTTYRIDRMLDIQLTEEPCVKNERIASFDIEEFRKCSFGMFKGSMTSATLLVQEGAMSGVLDRFGKDVRLGTPCGQYARVHVNVMESPTLFGWLAQFGTAVRLEAPAHLVCAYRRYLEEIIGSYPSKASSAAAHEASATHER